MGEVSPYLIWILYNTTNHEQGAIALFRSVQIADEHKVVFSPPSVGSVSLDITQGWARQYQMIGIMLDIQPKLVGNDFY